MGIFYSSADIDENIVCAYCKQQFLDVAKLVPECGESICGHCYEDLKDSVNAASDQFECLACKEMHEMPEKGLGDNKAILKLLNRKKITRPLSEQEDKLKRTLESLHCQLNELRLFDEREHVNQHCDMLEVEVLDEIDSLVKHLNEIGKDLLAEIRNYRERCLEKIEENKEEIQKRNAEELTSLSKELDQFGADWIGHFSRVESVVKDSQVKAATNQARLFETQINSLEQKMKSTAFQDEIMTFKPCHSFLGPGDHLKKYLGLSVNKKADRDHLTPFSMLVQRTGVISDILFLSNDILINCSHNQTIDICDVIKGTVICELDGHTGRVFAIEVLQNGWLASGSKDCTVKIWDLSKKSAIRTLSGHTDSVTSVKALKSGNLASLSTDDTIKIWDPYVDVGNLIWTMKGHGNTNYIKRIGTLSDDRLVTISHDCDSKEMCKLRVWDSKNGQMSMEINTGSKHYGSSLVLHNDKVVIDSDDGTIKFIDLAQVTSIVEVKAHSKSVTALAQFLKYRLVSAGVDGNFVYTLKVWDLASRMNLLQTINTGHSNYICRMSISPNEELLTTGSDDRTIKTWQISYK